MDKFLEYAKDLRKNSQIPEQILWSILRNRRFCNLKFRRQFSIGNYIVDFVCLEKRLVIELDGRQHLTEEALKYDEERSNYLKKNNFNVIRYYNTDILNNLETVLNDLWNKVN